MKRMSALFLFIILSALGFAQEPQRILTNSDVLNMAKSGLSDQTIVSVIQKGQTKFDTSPEALISLKKDGVSDQVLNAMLEASANSLGKASPEMESRAGMELLNKTIDSLGPREKINAIHSIKRKGTSVETPPTGASASIQIERITVYPGSIFSTRQSSNGLVYKMVITPEFNYLSSGKMINTVPANTLASYRDGIKVDPVYIAQHIGDYSCIVEGTEKIGDVNSTKLKITGPGTEIHWNIDPTNGRLMKLRVKGADSQEVVVSYSDWRLVNGVYLPFRLHSLLASGFTSDINFSEYEVNPAIDPKLFAAPEKQLAGGFTFKVLQSESVPYFVQTSGGISTSCQISGSTSTSYSSYTTGNSTFGNATSTPDLRMNCSSSDNTFRWNHVLNAMLVEASDGNAYIIACDRAWRWSKCTGLKPGDVFNARRTDKGFVVQFLNAKSEEKEATYSVLQAKVLQK